MSSEVRLSHSKRRLDFIDTLRGIACLWVIACHVHAYWLNGIRQHGWSVTTLVTRVAGYGGLGVDLFIVLSGFCLYWPLVRSEDNQSLHVATFFKRRAWRILPGYYSALLICFVLACIPALQPLLVSRPVTWFDFLLHLPLLQTFVPDSVASINGSLWTLSLEMQLYLAFPLVVWVVRRWGLLPAVILGILATSASWVAECLLHNAGASIALADGLERLLPARWIEFIAGMCAASAVAKPQPRHALKAGIAVIVLVPLVVASSPLRFPSAVSFPLFGAVFAASIVLAARLPDYWFRDYQSLGLLTSVGMISYSLYLVHQPLLLLMAPVVNHFGLSTLHVFAVGLFGFVPAAAAIAYGCYCIWERPFLRGHPSNTRRESFLNHGSIVLEATKP